MSANISFFPVDNGDMTLIKLDSGKTILIDVKIRNLENEGNNVIPDVEAKLRERIRVDDQGRPYVDVFLLTHPDQDHCLGLTNTFHLGPPEQYNTKNNKIFIRELWSSPIIFRRAGHNNLVLCEDAKSFNTEAKRRINLFKKFGASQLVHGNQILILGEDENGKTDSLQEILVSIDSNITKINGRLDPSASIYLLGPLPKSDIEDEEEALAKNRSSVILSISLNVNQVQDVCRFLSGGDAEVAIWERLLSKHKNTGYLQYDILQSPHHCSWHTLSHDSWSELGENAVVSRDALLALSQARHGALIISSSKPISGIDNDPPNIRAKREYIAITNNDPNRFKCTGEYPNTKNPDVMDFEITEYGPRLMSKPRFANLPIIGRQPIAHG